MTLTDNDEQVAINRARGRCYRRFSRIKFVELTEAQRKTYMQNCMRYELEREIALAKEREEIAKRRDPEEEIRQRNLERLERIKLEREMGESLTSPWE